MTYLDYIIFFEKCDQQQPKGFSGNATRLYVKLLAIANVIGNGRGPVKSFAKSDPYVAGACNLAINTMKDCRRMLVGAGLLTIAEGGTGRNAATTYMLLKPSNSDGFTAENPSNSNGFSTEKASNSDGFTAESEINPSNNPSNFDTLLIDKEITTSSAASAAGVGEALPEKSEPASPPARPPKPAGKNPRKVGASPEEIAALSLPHPGREFAEAWATFLTGSKQAGKTLNAYQLMLKHLGKKPEGFAIVMLERATVGNWQGVENPGTARAFTEWQAEQAELAARPPTPPATSADTTTRDQLFGYSLSAADGLARARQDPAYQRLLAEQQAAVTP